MLTHTVIGEIKGSEKPDEIIVVGGHLDSWDLGDGSHDDGAGIVQSMEVLRIFKSLNYIPKRTIRVVLFANEENGLRVEINMLKLQNSKMKNIFLPLNLMREVLLQEELVLIHLIRNLNP